MKKTGFTLAEVLITLGIIGIVAAIVMPTLIFDNQKNIIEARAGQTYSTLAQAIEMSELDNSKIEYWSNAISGNSATAANSRAFFEQYLAPYLKGASECGEGNDNDIKTKCGYPVSGAGISYTLPNGSSLSVLANPQSKMVAHITIDANAGEAPNKLGYDVFYFVIHPDRGLEPWGSGNNLSREDILAGNKTVNTGDKKEIVACLDESKSSTTLYRHGCTLLFVMDGMTFKDDYPWE